MKSSSNPETFRPFKKLKVLVKSHSKKKKGHLPAPQPISPSPTPPPEEIAPLEWPITFQDIVKGITPLHHNKFVRPVGRLSRRPLPHEAIQQKASRHLKDIIENGDHFTVANTPEYVEGTGYNIFPNLSKRLHDGEFSVQAYVDLHGLDREQGKVFFDNFLREAIKTNTRMLLVIHGRGLSSPGEPVLKKFVGRWLTSGQWRKWVLAFSSARPFDGGTGATYILLRKKPVTKAQRKGKRMHIHQEF